MTNDETFAGRYSRRHMLKKSTVVGLGAMAGGGLLAACGDGDEGAKLSGPAGLDTIPKAPFDPGAPAGAKPDLPRRIGWAVPAQVEIYAVLTQSLQQAGKEQDVEVLVAQANGDANKHVQQMNGFLTRKVAGMAVGPIEVETERPIQQRAIDAGVALFDSQVGPSTNRLAADQYVVGSVQGKAAAKWITEKLGGKAKVVHFEAGALAPPLKERDRGVQEGIMTAGSGVEIVGIPQGDATSQTGFSQTNTVLRKHPDAMVFVGGDSSVVGALAALEAAKKIQGDMYLSGINGDQEALDKIAQGGIYRASFAFAYGLVGYAWGRWTADWLEGKSIPQILYVPPIELSSKAAIDEFAADMEPANLKQTFDTPEKLNRYAKLVGNITYETRNQFLKKDF